MQALLTNLPLTCGRVAEKSRHAQWLQWLQHVATNTPGRDGHGSLKKNLGPIMSLWTLLLKCTKRSTVLRLKSPSLATRNPTAMACVNVPGQALAPISRLMARVWGNSDSNMYKDAKVPLGHVGPKDFECHPWYGLMLDVHPKTSKTVLLLDLHSPKMSSFLRRTFEWLPHMLMIARYDSCWLQHCGDCHHDTSVWRGYESGINNQQKYVDGCWW